MGGPWITPEVENLVRATWLDMKDKGPEPVAKEVSDAVRQTLQASGKDHLHAPGVRKTQDILKQARKALESRSRDQKELDDPWTIGSTVKHGIRSEAMPVVLRIWKLCVAAGVPFTIREAKWVDQLRSLFTDIIELRDVAFHYALKERAHEASESNEPFETYDLDGRLTMDIWEYATARLLGKMKSSSLLLENWILRPKSLCLLTGEGQKAIELTKRVVGFKKGLETDVPPEMFTSEGLKELQEKDRELSELELPDEAAWIFSHWLTYLSKGPKWSELSWGEIIDIVVKLREWVLSSIPPDLKEPAHLLSSLIESGSLEKYPKGDLTNLLMKPEMQPIELLKQVGY